MSRRLSGALVAFLLGWVVYFLVCVVIVVLGVLPLSLLVLWLKDAPIPTNAGYWFDVGLKWLNGAALASAALSVVMVVNALWMDRTVPEKDGFKKS
jgi:predicted anti-sigma-YlaC factor YlaD